MKCELTGKYQVSGRFCKVYQLVGPWNSFSSEVQSEGYRCGLYNMSWSVPAPPAGMIDEAEYRT